MGTALIGILGVVLGVVLSNLGLRILETIRRRERVQDVATAIRAEIRSHRQRLALFKESDASSIAERILEAPQAGSQFTPFVPKETRPIVFQAIVGDIHILPTQVIDPVIYFYRQIVALGDFADDLRSDRFANLDPARKADMYRDYIAMGAYALDLAELAIRALEDSSVARLRPGGTGNRGGRR